MPVTVTCEAQVFEVARVFCIGRNYAAHAAELGNEKPSEPVVFMKPPTAIVPVGKPVRLPRHRGEVHQEAEIVLLIGRDGADSAQDIAGVALGLDLTLRDEQSRLKAKGLPWELAKAFDDSAPLGGFVAPPVDFDTMAFECCVNGARRQYGEVAHMLFGPRELLAFLATRFRLRRGDLIFTGTPAGVGPLEPGDVIEVASAQLGRFSWSCE